MLIWGAKKVSRLCQVQRAQVQVNNTYYGSYFVLYRSIDWKKIMVKPFKLNCRRLFQAKKHENIDEKFIGK